MKDFIIYIEQHRDKVEHALFCILIVLSVALYTLYKYDATELRARNTAIIVAFFLSILKEVCDYFKKKCLHHGEGFSLADLKADIIGIILGSIILSLII